MTRLDAAAIGPNPVLERCAEIRAWCLVLQVTAVALFADAIAAMKRSVSASRRRRRMAHAGVLAALRARGRELRSPVLTGV